MPAQRRMGCEAAYPSTRRFESSIAERDLHIFDGPMQCAVKLIEQDARGPRGRGPHEPFLCGGLPDSVIGAAFELLPGPDL